MIKRFIKRAAKKLSLFLQIIVSLSVIFSSIIPATNASALSPEQKKIFGRGALYYDKGCTPGGGSTADVEPGSGSPEGLTFPKLDPDKMAEAIDKFVKKENPQSKMNNLGSTIVATGENSNVSPFLIVAIAYMESGLSDPGDTNVSTGNNSFGRKATSSQPNFTIGSTVWYKWSSVKASVDYTAHENKNAGGGGDIAAYLKEVFSEQIKKDDLVGLFTSYAGSGVASTYATNVEGWIKDMAKLAAGSAGGGSAGGGTAPTAPSARAAGGSAGTTDIKSVYMRGDSITAGAVKYYNIEGKFRGKGIDATVTGSGGGTVSTGGPDVSIQDGDLLSGLAALDRDKAKVRAVDAVVVAYGTNNYLGSRAAMETEIKKMVNKIRDINPSAAIFWVDIKITDKDGMDKINGAIEGLKTSLNYTVIHYSTSGIPLGDDFHPAFSEAGFGKWGQLVVDAVAEGTTSSGASSGGAEECCAEGGGGGGSTTVPGKNNEQKVWNFLVSPLPDGLGFNDKQAAGIMGNLKQENRAFDPAVVNEIGAIGIAQWTNPPNSNRRPELQKLADKLGGKESDFEIQLAFMKQELLGNPTSEKGGYEESTYNPIKNSDNLAEITRIWLEHYEVPCIPGPACDGEMETRLPFAVDMLKKYGGGGGGASVTGGSGGGCGGEEETVEDANMQKTIVDDSKAKFITMPSKYSCPGHTTKIDSRVAADLAYIITKYRLCANDGLAAGHLSHGAGVAVDLVPRGGNSKEDWKDTAEAAAIAIGWWGDSATDPKGSKSSCANYGSGDYGQCMHAVYPDKFPKWMRWMGYNGAYCHGDPWHLYGCSPHIHIGWDSPDGNATSSSMLSDPIARVYVFPAPVPDDLKSLVE